MTQWTKGTFLEGAVETTVSIGSAVWSGLQPVRDVMHAGGKWVLDRLSSVKKEGNVAKRVDRPLEHVSDKPLQDPVLERIRLERKQSKLRAHELVEHRRVIEQKERLLDRLEAERVMQLDKKEEVMAELDRSYSRTSRELSWSDLGRRFMWKLYASVRRGTKKVIAWWRGEIDPITGRPVQAGVRKQAERTDVVNQEHIDLQQEEIESISLEQPLILEPDQDELVDQDDATMTRNDQERAVADGIAQLSAPMSIDDADVAASTELTAQASAAIAQAKKASEQAKELLADTSDLS